MLGTEPSAKASQLCIGHIPQLCPSNNNLEAYIKCFDVFACMSSFIDEQESGIFITVLGTMSPLWCTMCFTHVMVLFWFGQLRTPKSWSEGGERWWSCAGACCRVRLGPWLWTLCAGQPLHAGATEPTTTMQWSHTATDTLLHSYPHATRVATSAQSIMPLPFGKFRLCIRMDTRR